jgi:hypothetical protein
MQGASFASVQRKLADQLARNIQLLSLSIDPGQGRVAMQNIVKPSEDLAPNCEIG